MTATTADPKDAGPKPPFSQPPIEPPGTEAEMTPDADHGERSYRGSGKLTGKAALITGADSGIGRAVALAYAREGADVLISYLSEDEDAEATRRLVADAGRKAIVVPGDIGDEKHCIALVDRAVGAFGRLDVLVNNAAFQRTYESIADLTAGELEKTFRTNLFAMYYLCKAALPKMQKGGAIVNTASIQGFEPSPQLLAYAPTKAAVINFTKALVSEAVGRGVRVNAVAPGPVWTPLIPSTMPQDKAKEFGKNTAFGRPAQPAELAPLFVWLASAEASYVTGEVYGATGGRTPF